ncbi:DnaJ domain-containing protein [Halorussus salilacus]|uniref:ferredoxin Fer n=1 Tax=Halorussus salilacus TaxID=2953750 RepID=UPI0020A12524|nr:ferredoxin Fer [Halorussus salilacus]USZ66752.1 DnaJ domain-containing protein [Halorussus salilacus]
MESPFEVLGIDRDADDEDIKRAYKRRVKEAHPDHGGTAEEFQAVREAYDRLSSGDVPPPREDDPEESVQTETEAERRARERAETRRRDEVGERRERSDARVEQEPTESRVEFLNYEVLDDRGWSLDDEDLFEKAADADLEPPDYGRITVDADDPLLEAAEDGGFTWPYSCRGGACANCAVAVLDGDLSMPSNHILPPDLLDRGIRLSCIGTPTAETMQVVYNVKYLPDLDELRLPPGPFEHAQD